MDNTDPLIPFEKLAAPARRALQSAGWTTLKQLARVRESDVATLHGIGPNALKILHKELAEHGMSFIRD